MLNVIKADAGSSGRLGNRPGSYKCSWSACIMLKFALLGFLCDALAN